MASNEKAIQKAVLKYLTLKYKGKGRTDTVFWRENSGATRTERGGFIRFGFTGAPDIFVVQKGRIYGLEIKDKAKQSDGQKEFQKCFENAGGEYFIIRSIDDVIKIGL